MTNTLNKVSRILTRSHNVHPDVGIRSCGWSIQTNWEKPLIFQPSLRITSQKRFYKIQRDISQAAHPARLTGINNFGPNPNPNAATNTSSPLSVLPTSALLRSLCINYISSSPWLLGIAIRMLSYVSRPRPFFLLDPKRNRLLSSALKWTVFKQFCAGETASEVRSTLKFMKSLGFRGTIVTFGKEIVFDHKNNSAHGAGVNVDEVGTDSSECPGIRAWQDGTIETLEMLGEGDHLAIKITGAGPQITDALSARQLPPQQMMNALRTISARCKKIGARVLVDAESQKYQHGIFLAGIELMREFNRDGHAVIYNTYQAYLTSTPSMVQEHLAIASAEGFTLGLKLVRGAYIDTEKRSLICTTKEDTDAAYNNIAQGAIKRNFDGFGDQGQKPFPSCELILASHNKKSVMAAHKLHQDRAEAGLPTVPVAYAQLQGMSDDVSFALLNMRNRAGTSPELYKCSTWGTLEECMGYLARRACENRDAASRTTDEYSAMKTETWRRLKRIFVAP